MMEMKKIPWPEGVRQTTALPQCRVALLQWLRELTAAMAACTMIEGFAPPDFEEDEWRRVSVLAELLREELEPLEPAAVTDA